VHDNKSQKQFLSQRIAKILNSLPAAVASTTLTYAHSHAIRTTFC